MISQSVLEEFAPLVNLHPYDMHRPVCISNFLYQTNPALYLYDSGGNILAKDISYQILSDEKYNQEGNYLGYPSDDDYPTASKDYQTGDPLTSDGTSPAHMYVKVLDKDKYYNLVYVMFYVINGFQLFRIEIDDYISSKKHANFEWARFARHGADVEHVTVSIDKDATKVLGAYYSQHSGSLWIQNPPKQDNHVIVYSAWNSHANYCSPCDTNLNPGNLPIPDMPPIRWMEIIDTTEVKDSKHDKDYSYGMPSPYYDNPLWKPWESNGQVVNVDEDQACIDFFNFKGHYGPNPLDNTHIDTPPDMPEDAHKILFVEAKIIEPLLPSSIIKCPGPESPQYQHGGWWADLEA